MKKLLFLFFICFSAISVKAEEWEQYRIPNYVTVEEFKALIGKTFLYYPTYMYIPYTADYDYLLTGMFSDKLTLVTLTAVEGTTKKDKPFNKMKLTFSYIRKSDYRPEGYSTKTITYYSGNYPKATWSYKNEYNYNDLTLIDYEKWKADNNDVGKEFTNPLVKAKYTVTNVSLEYLGEKHSEDSSTKMFKCYTIKNSETGAEYTVKASDGAKAQFADDLSGEYRTYLSKVENTSNPSINDDESLIVKAGYSNGIQLYSYADKFIDIAIGGSATKFYFTLKNISENTQKLIWDEAAYVDYNGITSKVMHSGIKYSQREASQPASTIIKGSNLEDIVCPISNVRYNEIVKDWITDSMYPLEPGVSKQIKLMLPIQIKDVTNEYIFVFDIKYDYDHPDRLKNASLGEITYVVVDQQP